MNAVLLIIGDEILSGSTQDINSHFLATQLQSLGIKVAEILSISDDEKQIGRGLDAAFKISDLVIATGGLGPTRDDKTKKAFAVYFNDELVFDEAVFAHLKRYLEKRNRLDILNKNYSQAEVFKNGKVFLNEYGTAPCLMHQMGEKMVFCLPGVPTEVKPLMKDKIIPFLKTHFNRAHILTQVISVVGIPESVLAAQISSWELGLPSHFALSYLPVGTRIKLKLTASGQDLSVLKKEMTVCTEQLFPLIKNNLLSTQGEKIEEILKSVLLQRGLSISCAESCTGGGIARLITSVPGSSRYFAGGICTYQTAMKTTLLNVPQDLITKHTVVSAEVAEAMSAGCQKMFDTDIAVATTGVAGPGSDDFNNEIGLVFVSVRTGSKKKILRLHLPFFEREDFMNYVSERALQTVVEILHEEESEVTTETQVGQ